MAFRPRLRSFHQTQQKLAPHSPEAEEVGFFYLDGTEVPALKELRVCGAFHTRCTVVTSGDCSTKHDDNVALPEGSFRDSKSRRRSLAFIAGCRQGLCRW